MDSRDDCARRKVADAVKAVAVEGAERAAAHAYVGAGWLKDACADVGTAASAVVLASDLRAPGEVECAEAQMGRAPCGVSPNRRGWRARLANVERLLSEFWDTTPSELEARDWAKVQDALSEVRAILDERP